MYTDAAGLWKTLFVEKMGSDLTMRQTLSCEVAPTNMVPVIVLDIVTFASSIILHQLHAVS